MLVLMRDLKVDVSSTALTGLGMSQEEWYMQADDRRESILRVCLSEGDHARIVALAVDTIRCKLAFWSEGCE
jgi:hypothetical protein